MTIVASDERRAVDWREANRTYLELEFARLRLLLRKRVSWLRSVREGAEAKAHAIVEREVDRLLTPPTPGGERAFYRDDPDARRIARELHLLDEERARCFERRERSGATAAMERLVALFGLGPFERDVLVACMACERDPGFGRLYGYAQDDATLCFPTERLLLEVLLEDEAARADARHAFLTHAPLMRFRLVEVDTPDACGPRRIRLPERVLAYAEGFDDPGPVATRCLSRISVPTPVGLHAEVAERIALWAVEPVARSAWPRLNLIGAEGAGKRVVARAVLERLDLGLRELDLAAALRSPDEIVSILEREAVLEGLGLYVDASSISGPDGAAPRALVDELLHRLHVFLIIGSEHAWPTRSPLLGVAVDRPTRADQVRFWQEALASTRHAVDEDLPAIVEQFDLGPEEIGRSAAIAAANARLRDPDAPAVELADLRAACLARGSHAIGGFARRIVPCHERGDIVLPPDSHRQLDEVRAQVAHRETVYGRWGFGRKLGRGRGVSALFAGPSGTGKTLAAEILARELGLDMFAIDLSSVVDKYVGETEKNLRRLFDAAERSGVILFFDEADALFGKRSEVKDSHDRYANIEIDYLLQRMEAFSGLAILATNLKDHLDQAFLRRLRFVIEFPLPDAGARRAIWERLLPPETPTEDLRFDDLARLELAGGNIKNIVLNAAFMAAAEGRALGMEQLMRASVREYSKEEKLVTRAEFGAHYPEGRRQGA